MKLHYQKKLKLRLLIKKEYTNILTSSRRNLDLENQQEVLKFFNKNSPEIVIIAAAKVGGIKANMNFQYDFLMKNLLIQINLIEASRISNVKKVVFLGSSCIYPKFCDQPIKEDYLLSGKLEETNEGYAISKIAGLKLCEKLKEQYNIDSLSIMPCNLYGYNDNYNLKTKKCYVKQITTKETKTCCFL